MVKLGFHVSISGSIDMAVDRALELDCNTFQIFTGNPRQLSGARIRRLARTRLRRRTRPGRVST